MFKVAIGSLAIVALTLAIPTASLVAQDRQGPRGDGPRGQAVSAPASSGPQMRGPEMRGQGMGMMRGQGQGQGPAMQHQGPPPGRGPATRPAYPAYRPGMRPPVARPPVGHAVPRPHYGRPVYPAYPPVHYYSPWYWGEAPSPGIYAPYGYGYGYPYGVPGLSVNGFVGYGPMALNLSWLHVQNQNDSEDEAANVGKIKFAVEPKSAIVLIDGSYVGEVRDLGKGIKLGAGTHTITVVVGDVQKEFKVDILPGQTITIRAKA